MPAPPPAVLCGCICPDGSFTTTEYCGPHSQTTVTGIVTSLDTPSATQTTLPGGSPTLTAARQVSGSIVIDHNSVELFDQIPDAYIEAAAQMRMLFIDRSVGQNINEGLDCLAFSTDEEAPNVCRRGDHPMPEFSAAEGDLDWSRPGGYDRDNWDYQFWPDGDCSEWFKKVGCFEQAIKPQLANYEVFSFQMSYLEIMPGSTIGSSTKGFFVDHPGVGRDVYDQEAYEADHPDEIFIYWTSSLARALGTTVGEAFNQQMREYAIEHGKPLFDVAATGQ